MNMAMTAVFLTALSMSACSEKEGWVGAEALAAVPDPASTVGAVGTVPVMKPSDWKYDGKDGSKSRVKAAYDSKEAAVKKMFNDAGVVFPPAELVFRVYKWEEELQVWASSKRGEPMKHIATYMICSMSGTLGPKRVEGDGQVPEGFYKIDSLNPHSSFYLSMHVNYPNASDRVLSNRTRPGSAIMIHGNCCSAGCLAMTDERIQELWVMAEGVRTKKGPHHVYIFPGKDWEQLLKKDQWKEHVVFWTNLKQGHDLFEKNKQLLDVSVDRTGKYIFSN